MGVTEHIEQMSKLIERGTVRVEDIGTAWRITAPTPSFLEWMRHSYKDKEDVTWQLWFTGASIQIIEIIDEEIMTMVTLKWT